MVKCFIYKPDVLFVKVELVYFSPLAYFDKWELCMKVNQEVVYA